MKKAEFIFSNKGKDWNDKKLNEDNLLSNQLVKWRNYLYKTGNRYHEYVELYDVLGNEFVRTVNISYVYLCKENYVLNIN